jgi:hypothetical protein
VRRHDLDLVSLITGGVFALVAVGHLVGAATGDSMDPLWLAPALLIGLGLAGLAGALRSSSRTDDQTDVPTDARTDDPERTEDATATS